MRIPQYISPSALQKWEYSQEEYFLSYLAENSPPRMPQTEAMSIGSAFDAYVKSKMFYHLFGASDPQFEFDTIFEAQVEEHNRDWARDAGKYVFDCYVELGAYADLLKELEQAQEDPRFEDTVTGTVAGVPLLGKPDVYYLSSHGVRVILDWKVNGFVSKNSAPPKRGYIRIRGDSISGAHPKAEVSKVKGVEVNTAETLDAIEKSWAMQTATYAWLCGSEIGDPFVAAIDQICCTVVEGPKYPVLRVAEHRAHVGEQFQHELRGRYQWLWDVVNSDWIFRAKSKQDSERRCRVLEQKHAAYSVKESEKFIQSLL